jgi:hypothetical protein
MLKISYRLMTNNQSKKSNKKHVGKPGYCQACGAKLTSPRSIRLGYGCRCLENRVIIVLEMIPDKKAVTT